jgi:hypothetical protein
MMAMMIKGPIVNLLKPSNNMGTIILLLNINIPLNKF